MKFVFKLIYYFLFPEIFNLMGMFFYLIFVIGGLAYIDRGYFKFKSMYLEGVAVYIVSIVLIVIGFWGFVVYLKRFVRDNFKR